MAYYNSLSYFMFGSWLQAFILHRFELSNIGSDRPLIKLESSSLSSCSFSRVHLV